jgi:hypothetical protein
MSDRPEDGEQVPAINPFSPFIQTSFDLERFDKFSTGLGVDFIHYKAIVSPIGVGDRGDYRREDGPDTITANGMVYFCAGKFTATMTDNSRNKGRSDGGEVDPSTSRLVMPRFYNKLAVADGDRIYMNIGDRVYIADPDADVNVSNYQRMTFAEGENIPMFPIVSLEAPILDSKNIQYIQGVDFNITPKGNICWIPGGKHPGFDPVTGKGRVYSIRYLYRAYYYVTSIPKEIRVTNITTNGIRNPQRAPFYAMITREYVYHNQNRADQKNVTTSKSPDRAVTAPIDNPKADPGIISVDMTNFSIDGSDDGSDQS